MPDPAEFADWTVTMTATDRPTITATYRRCSEGQARKFAYMQWASAFNDASIPELDVTKVDPLP